jgi:hypothetical protein
MAHKTIEIAIMLDIMENFRCSEHTEAPQNVGVKRILENKCSLQKRMENIDHHFLYTNLTEATYIFHFHAVAGFVSSVQEGENRIKASGCLFAKSKVEHRLRTLERKMVTGISGRKKETVIGGWIKLHNEKLHGIYLSLSTFRVMN